MQEDSFYLPEYLDEPEKIIFFTVDEFLVLMGPVALGIECHALLTGLIIGGLSLLGLLKLKGQGGQDYLQRAIYWYLPAVLSRLKKMPPSFVRHLIG